MWYNVVMSKNFKRCPRCNTKVPINWPKCGECSLNFDKFNSATNTEAKTAMRINETERVLFSTNIPSDVSRKKILISSIFGGWFGLEFFLVGRKYRGIFQLVSFILGMIYCACLYKMNVLTGNIGNLILLCGIVWAIGVVLWLSTIVKIIFKRFKYPVALPYSWQEPKQDKKGE